MRSPRIMQFDCASDRLMLTVGCIGQAIVQLREHAFYYVPSCPPSCPKLIIDNMGCIGLSTAWISQNPCRNQECCHAQADVPKLPSILPGEPPRPSDTPVAALNRAADAVAQSASESTSTTNVTATGSPASPAGSGASALSVPAAATGASAITQQAALQSGAGSVTSQRGQGWLRAMWNRCEPPIGHECLLRSSMPLQWASRLPSPL